MKRNTLVLLSATALLAALPVKSQAQGWQTVLDYQSSPGLTSVGEGIATAPNGQVLCVGIITDVNGITHGIALTNDTTQLANAYADHSAIPGDLSDDNNFNPSQYNADAWECGFDSAGNLYSIGQHWPFPITTGEVFWYVREQSSGGGKWSTVDQYEYTAGQ